MLKTRDEIITVRCEEIVYLVLRICLRMKKTHQIASFVAALVGYLLLMNVQALSKLQCDVCRVVNNVSVCCAVF